MDFNNVDNELNLKMIEVFKMILKKQETNIIFEENNISSYYDELTHISNKEHNFSLYSHKETISVKELNYKFYKILPKSIKKEHINLTDTILINKVISNKYYKFLIFFLGKIYYNKELKIQHYKINYNNVVIELDKYNYEKLMFYTKTAYKLQQLNKLNYELNIDQKYNIVFDDEIVKNDLYSNFYINFKDIIKPPN